MRVYNNENIRVGSNVTETVGGDQTITIGAPTSGGDFTLNAVQTVTINVGPPGAPPLTQIKMDQTSITLNVGPEGLIALIVMGPDGVKVKRDSGVGEPWCSRRHHHFDPDDDVRLRPGNLCVPDGDHSAGDHRRGSASGLPII